MLDSASRNVKVLQVSNHFPSPLKDFYSRDSEDIAIKCGFKGQEGLKSFLVEDFGVEDAGKGLQFDNTFACKRPLHVKRRETLNLDLTPGLVLPVLIRQGKNLNGGWKA